MVTCGKFLLVLLMRSLCEDPYIWKPFCRSFSFALLVRIENRYRESEFLQLFERRLLERVVSEIQKFQDIYVTAAVTTRETNHALVLYFEFYSLYILDRTICTLEKLIIDINGYLGVLMIDTSFVKKRKVEIFLLSILLLSRTFLLFLFYKSIIFKYKEYFINCPINNKFYRKM